MSTAMTKPVDRVRLRTHRAAVTSGITQVVDQLQATLGQALVAVLVGKEMRTVARWARGDSRPPAKDDRLLRDALQVQTLLLDSDSADIVRAWFVGMNPQLDDTTPLEALADGRARDVMAAARAFADAG